MPRAGAAVKRKPVFGTLPHAAAPSGQHEQAVKMLIQKRAVSLNGITKVCV
jgi:hypothetical protein